MVERRGKRGKSIQFEHALAIRIESGRQEFRRAGKEGNRCCFQLLFASLLPAFLILPLRSQCGSRVQRIGLDPSPDFSANSVILTIRIVVCCASFSGTQSKQNDGSIQAFLPPRSLRTPRKATSFFVNSVTSVANLLDCGHRPRWALRDLLLSLFFCRSNCCVVH